MADNSEQLFDKHLAAGDASFVEEDYQTALQHYHTAQPLTDLQRFRLLHHRSATHYKLQQFQASYTDAQAAHDLQLQDVLSKREVEGVLRTLGLASVELSRYDQAKEALQEAQKLSDGSTFQYNTFLETIDSKLASNLLQPTAAAPVPPPTVSSPASIQNPATTKKKALVAPKYQYYQSDKFMTISILESNVQAENLDVQIEADSIVVQLRKCGEQFTVIAGMLSEPIDVEQSKVAIKDEKVLVKLRKVEAKEWYDLLDPKKKLRVAPTTTANTAAAPRPYASDKDWNQIEQKLKQEEEAEQPKGDEAMNKLFQQIYKDADPDTRRAMIKSYQTSGGTCLSTNWDEVAKKDYEKERTAPDGQEWKTWEGQKLPATDD